MASVSRSPMAFFMLIIGAVVILYAGSIFGYDVKGIFGFVFSIAPIWLPLILFILLFDSWLLFVQLEYDLSQGRTTLEIKLPQEVFKSPEAMEQVLIQMHQIATPDNHVQTYWDGKHPPMFSLELVSRGGDVKLYINTPEKKFKNLVETQLYAQYPGIEIVEHKTDYTSEISWDLDKYAYFSLHMGLKKADAYPLKSYFEYALQSMPKEEEKVDPITSMIEMLGSIGPGEHYWIQILIEANREQTLKSGSLGLKPDWRGDARKEIQNIIDSAVKQRGGEDYNQAPTMLLTDAEKDTIKAIERSTGKNAFNTVIRAMYIGEKEAFNPGERIGTLITGFRAYDDLNRNAIGVRWRTDFDWNWWQDPRDKHKNFWKKTELREYKTRRYTSYTAVDKPKIMTTEELATLFHLPGQVVATPTLERIPSKRSEPPANLPV